MAMPSDQKLHYLKTHDIEQILNTMVNKVAESQPDNPIDYIANQMIYLQLQQNMEKPAILQHLDKLADTLKKDKKIADQLQQENDALKIENEKLKYRIAHLLQAWDKLEKPTTTRARPPAANNPHIQTTPTDLTQKVPIGHTAYSWAGGIALVADASAAPPPPVSLVRAKSSGTLSKEAFSERHSVVNIMRVGSAAVGEQVSVAGWIRSSRMQKGLSFVSLNDGSCMASLQLVVENAADVEELTSKGCTTSTSISAQGTLVASPGKGQALELKVSSLCVLGSSDGGSYPLAKKGHSLDFLRSLTHLRPRTNTFGAVMRIRNELAYATHTFFQSHNFMYVHTPLITGSDCEGAGEMFRVTTLDVNNLPTLPGGQGVDFSQDFFDKPSFLTVSGQLNAEHYACAFGSVYTFGPTFRAENSNTTRHLAEFWMIEPEIAFADLEDDMNLAEAYLQHCLRHVLENCEADVAFLEQHYDKELSKTLRMVSSTPFERLTYTRAVEICAQRDNGAFAWEHAPEWGEELHTEHERYLAESVFHKPVIVYNYPKACKAFYMRLNDGEPPDRQTVAAMDVLFPRLGEMVGGSQREERLDVLLARMQEAGLPVDEYQAYVDLRRFGTQKHAGFGVGFERLVSYATGMTNIRDVIPYPRAPHTMQN